MLISWYIPSASKKVIYFRIVCGSLPVLHLLHLFGFIKRPNPNAVGAMYIDGIVGVQVEIEQEVSFSFE